MKAKKKGTRAKLRDGQSRGRMMMSLDINTGVEKLRPEDLLQREMPSSVNDAFLRARGWVRDNWLVESMIYLQKTFYNYGLEFVVTKGEGKKAKEVDLDLELQMDLERLVGEVWQEWLALDTVVGFWREENQTQPFLLPPENCKYSDRFGIEKMRVLFNYKKVELEGEGADGLKQYSADEVRRYTGNKEVELSEEYDEYFRVMTRGKKGEGFGWPRMRALFRTCLQNESMEVGEAQVAYLGRLVEREHKIGFEVRSGSNAPRQDKYLWDKKRADGIQTFYAARKGGTETVKQFDHHTSYVFVPADAYKAEKWLTFINRAIWWAGPLGWMYLAKTVNPQLLKMLRSAATEERRHVGKFCEFLIAKGWSHLPGKIQIRWSDEIFLDERLAWDMLKESVNRGPASLTTLLERAGMDPEEERERKRDEAREERRDELVPLFDPHHGNQPGQAGGAQAGAGRPTVKTGNKE